MRALLLCGLVAAALTGGGCITPSIPIPPPSPQQMVFEVDLTVGEATFSYPATDNYADAIVYVYNRDLQQGVIDHARADGSVGPTPPFPIENGNRIAVTFETDEAVVSTCVQVQDGQAAQYCQ